MRVHEACSSRYVSNLSDKFIEKTTNIEGAKQGLWAVLVLLSLIHYVKGGKHLPVDKAFDASQLLLKQ